MKSAPQAAAAIPSTRQLRGRAFSLGFANAIDYALQFLLPAVLVRYLDADDFGEYRLLWLAVGTVITVATMAMPPGSLYYFVPRSDAALKRLYINQTFAFLVATGLISAWAVSGFNPWLPERMQVFVGYGPLVPLFVCLWLISSLVDVLPTIDERIPQQARITVTLSLTRAAALSAVAMLTHDLGPVLLAMVIHATFKLALLLRYVAIRHGWRGPAMRWRLLAHQIRTAAPMGAASALWGLRTQADQWVAAALFSLGSFGAFSIGAVLAPLINLFRLSVNFAFLPSMSRLEAAGDIRQMLKLNSDANVMVATVVFPLFAFVFDFAQDLVTIVYTSAYVDAAMVMRVYIIGMAALLLELSSATMLLRLAPFVTVLNLVALIIAIPLNWVFALNVGLPGAAFGSVAMLYFDRAVTLWRIGRTTGTAVSQLQDWKGLARPLVHAVIAAAVAWSVVAHTLAASDPYIRAAVGGATLAAVYGALYGLWRLRRDRD